MSKELKKINLFLFETHPAFQGMVLCPKCCSTSLGRDLVPHIPSTSLSSHLHSLTLTLGPEIKNSNNFLPVVSSRRDLSMYSCSKLNSKLD